MATHTKGLGKGLSALMSEDYSRSVFNTEAAEATSNSIQHLALDLIVAGAYQPRKHFNESYLNELAESIKKNGIMQPIIVRPLPNDPARYEIIAGERRWRASKLAQLSSIPAIIRNLDDKQALELAIIENIQRQDLSPLEEAASYQRLVDDFAYTQEEIASTVGKSRSHIANLLRLLTLPERVKHYLEEQKISMGHARALLNAPLPEKMVETVVSRGLNVRQTEQLVRTPEKAPYTPPNTGYSRTTKEKDPDILALEATLSENLGMRISIQDQGKRGQITIQYESLSQLDHVLRRLGSNNLI